MNVQLDKLSAHVQMRTIAQIMQKYSTLRLVTALYPTSKDITVPRYLRMGWHGG